MRRMTSGTEHTFTQWVTVQCPSGHRVGRVESSIVPQVHVRPLSASDSDPNQFDQVGDRLTYSCAACRKAGAFDFRGSFPLSPVVELLAALFVYGPAHTKVRLTRSALRDKIAATIGRDGEDPSDRARRRDYFTARTNTRQR